MSDTGNDPTENLHAQVELALEALDADALREVVLDVLLALEPRTLAAVAPGILERAARSGADWRPDPLNESEVAEAVAFAAAAERIGYAEPADVDTHLNNAGLAFLGRDYPAAYRIFHALIPPLAERMFHLGEDEMLDEVLGVDPGECAGQYLVCVYLLRDEGERPQALRETLNELRGFCFVSEPIRVLERAALDPLPGLDDFLHGWRGLLEGDAAGESGPWDSLAAQWLREAVRRLEGAAGLAELARSSRRAPDLRAWCASLVEDRDWPAALAAFAEAAELADDEWLRASLFGGAALCAQELGGEDLSVWLERAWRSTPSLTRLLRWLGAAPDEAALQHRAALALAACPPAAHRQRAWLHVLRGEFDAAAALLAAAPGLGWSSPEHPGHFLFPVFQFLLGGRTAAPPMEPAGLDGAVGALHRVSGPGGPPRLATPEPGDILRLAGGAPTPSATDRTRMLAALRTAAEKRVAGVTGEKRRRHYGHAASLVAACLACDRTPDASRWALGIRDAYRRYPAFRAEFDQHMERP